MGKVLAGGYRANKMTRLLVSLLAAMLAAMTGAFTASAQDWGQVTTPTPGPPQSIGFYSAGCLQGAQALPLDGPGYEAIRISRRGTGRPRTRPGAAMGDKAYSSAASRSCLRKRGIKIGSKRLGAIPGQKCRTRTNDPAAISRLFADILFPSTVARTLRFVGPLALSTLHR